MAITESTSHLSPKKQAIREREQRILDIARSAILELGYHGLSMDRIADKLSISKGTIYNHFSCKEEIIIALAIETAEKRRELFQQAAEFRGRSRFRMMALGQADIRFFEQHTNHFEFERMLRIPSILEKTSEKRRGVMQMCEVSCMQIVGGIVRDAVANEDLQLADGMTVEEVVFGLWSLHYGAQSIIASSEDLQQIGLSKPVQTMIQHSNVLLDGLGWKPFSEEFDQQDILERIHNEVFDIPNTNK